MHDLDRTQLEFDQPGEIFESEQFEFISDEVGEQMEGSFDEVTEMELASELLEVSSDAELDQFLGKLIKKAGGMVKRFVKSPIGRSLGGILKGAVKQALPVVGGALGSMVAPGIGTAIGSRLGSAAGSMFGLELEGLSNEDQEFEVARRYVRFAGAAAQKAALASPSTPPGEVAKTAVIEAAKQYAPGLLRKPGSPNPVSGGVSGRRSGRWYRHGNRIIIQGV